MTDFDWSEAGTYFFGLLALTFVLGLFKCLPVAGVYWIIYFIALSRAIKEEAANSEYRDYMRNETSAQLGARVAYGPWWTKDFYNHELEYDINKVDEKLIKELERTRDERSARRAMRYMMVKELEEKNKK